METGNKVNAIKALTSELDRLRAENAALREALTDMCALVEKHTYPTPDKPESNWGRLQKAKQALTTQTEGDA